jgi:hypothetical protein
MDNFLGQVRLSQGDNDAAARLFTDGPAVARHAQDRIALRTWPGTAPAAVTAKVMTSVTPRTGSVALG